MDNLNRIRVVLAAALLGISTLGLAADGPKTFADLKHQHEKLIDEAYARGEKAASDAERRAATDEIWKQTKSAAREAFAWAEAHPDDPEAIDAIVWTVHGLANGYYPEYVDEIARAHQ